MTCRWCARALHPCPSRMFPAHMAHCNGWVHGDGTHGDGHLAEPAEDGA